MGALVGCDGGNTDDMNDDTKDSDESTDTEDTDEGTDTDTPTDPTVTRFRVVHLSPDAPPVSIWADGAGKLADNLAFGGSSDWIEVPAGTYDVKVRAAGAAESDAVVFPVDDVALAEGDDLTVLAVGSFASTAAADRFRVLPLLEDFDAPGADSIGVRLVHASPDAPTVGIDVGNDNPAAPEVTDFARFAETGAAGIALPSDTTLRVGIAAGGATVTSFTVPSLPEGSTWTVVASGFLGDKPRATDGFALFAIPSDGQPIRIAQDPTVHVLHASPDAPAVDLFAGSARIGANLAFGELAAVQVSPGTYDIDIFGASASATRPDGDPAYTVAKLAVEAGERYIAIATGFLGSTDPADQFRVLAYADTFDLAETDAQIGFVHASPDTPAVDISTVAGGNLTTPKLFEDVMFGEAASGTVVVPPGSYTLGASAAGTNAALVRFNVAVASGTAAWAIAGGQFPGAGISEPLRLFVIDTSAWPWAVADVAPTM